MLKYCKDCYLKNDKGTLATHFDDKGFEECWDGLCKKHFLIRQMQGIVGKGEKEVKIREIYSNER